MTTKLQKFIQGPDENRYGKIVYEGWLNKRSKGKSWQKRYGVLWEDCALRFYDSFERGKVIGKIKLKHVDQVSSLTIKQSQQINFNKPYFFGISSKQLKKQWQFGCENDELLSKWVNILNAATNIKQNQINNNNNNNQTKNNIQQNNNDKHKKILKPSENELNKKQSKNNTTQHMGRGRNLSLMDGDISIQSASSITNDESVLSSAQSLSGLKIFDENEEYGINGNRMDNNNNNIDDVHTNVVGNIDHSLGNIDELPSRNREVSVSVSVSLRTKENEKTLMQNVKDKLQKENDTVIYRGYMDRKTNQKVLGKRLWETRFYKLSTHSLSVYINNEIEYPESVIKLSSVVSVSKSFKGIKNGDMKSGKRIELVITSGKSSLNELTNNKGTINTQFNTETIDLRCPTANECNLWIKHLTLEKRKHRKSIRSGLESLALFQMRQEKINKQKIKYAETVLKANKKLQAQDNDENKEEEKIETNTNQTTLDTNSGESKTETNETTENNDTTKEDRRKMMKKQQSKRFKRTRTRRGTMENNDKKQSINNENISNSENENDSKSNNNSDDPSISESKEKEKEILQYKKNKHQKTLTLRSWAINATSIDASPKFNIPNIDIITKDIDNNIDDKPKLSEPIEYKGDLWLKVGYNDNNGNKYYFELSDDTLEYFNTDMGEMMQLRSESMLIGSISMSHIKSIKMGNNKNEFILVFDNDSNNDWILNTLNNDNKKAEIWYNKLTQAINEAKAVEQTIVNENNVKTPIITSINEKKDIKIISLNEKSNVLNKRMIKRGKSQFKALHDFINEETMNEIEMTNNNGNNNKNLDEFDLKINNNQGNNMTEVPQKKGCLCFR